VLLVPTERCVGPECKGASAGGTRTLGYGGDLDAGSRGAFFQAGRLIGTTALDGVEIAKGMAAIEGLRESGAIDSYYSGAAKRAYLERIGDAGERAAPFEEPSPFGVPLAPSALSKRFAGISGPDVGPSVREGCACKEREPDARDPLSGWLIYYVPGGILLTPTKKCIAGGGKAPSFWGQTWRNVLSLVQPTPPTPAPVEVLPLVQAPAPVPSPVSPPPSTGGYICGTPPGWWPGYVVTQKDPCRAPLIELGRT